VTRTMSIAFDYFVEELIRSDLRKRAGEPWPWTDNPFCATANSAGRGSRTTARRESSLGAGAIRTPMIPI